MVFFWREVVEFKFGQIFVDFDQFVDYGVMSDFSWVSG